VRVLGREVLQKPSRVSYLSSQDRIVVTDDGTKSLRVFSASDGSDLGTLCPPVELENSLEHPVAHCEMNDGRIAVLDFKSKAIVMWNLVERNATSKILTNMHCPAYLAVTSSGCLAVTDWKVSDHYRGYLCTFCWFNCRVLGRSPWAGLSDPVLGPSPLRLANALVSNGRQSCVYHVDFVVCMVCAIDIIINNCCD